MGDTLKAVLFDMDGTLVDTEPYWIAAEQALVAAHGGTWSDTQAQELVGSALLRAAEILRDVAGVDLPPPEIVELLLDEVVAQVRTRIVWRPGARELLEQCRAAAVPTALVTMSYHRLVEAVVGQLPEQSFAVLVTGDQVRHGKPHPEAYLTACRRLGVSPATTVALEDSPTGVASAEAAGCVTVAIPHQVPIAASSARLVIPTLSGFGLAELEALMTG